MAVIVNGISRQVIVNGAVRTAAIVNGINRIDTATARAFNLGDAGINFCLLYTSDAADE